jgi:hypothetical protein
MVIKIRLHLNQPYSKLAFVLLVIEDRPSCTQYLARLDLFKHCYEVATELASIELEIIKPTAKHIIKKLPKEEGGSI